MGSSTFQLRTTIWTSSFGRDDGLRAANSLLDLSDPHRLVELCRRVSERVAAAMAIQPPAAHVGFCFGTQGIEPLDKAAGSFERIRFDQGRAVGGHLPGDVYLVAEERDGAASQRVGHGDA